MLQLIFWTIDIHILVFSFTLLLVLAVHENIEATLDEAIYVTERFGIVIDSTYVVCGQSSLLNVSVIDEVPM